MKIIVPFNFLTLVSVSVRGFSSARHNQLAFSRHNNVQQSLASKSSNYNKNVYSHIQSSSISSYTILNSRKQDLDVIGDGNGNDVVTKRSNTEESIMDKVQKFRSDFSMAASEGFGTRARNVASIMKVGDVVVPLCGNLAQRQTLANSGIYPGVEYEVCSLQLNNKEIQMDKITSSTDRNNFIAYVKPAYELRDYLERDDWPVSVKPFQDVPLWLSKATWLGSNLLGTFFLSFSYLSIAAVLAFFVRFTYVPTESMIPALNPGDVTIVTRSIPIGPLKTKVGDVVLFDPPAGFNDRISNILMEQKQRGKEVAEGIDNEKEPEVMSINKPQQGEQFLKRVVAVAGEDVGVKNAQPVVALTEKDSDINKEAPSTRKFRVDIIGPYAYPELFPPSSWERQAETLGKNQVFVAGDNGFRSVDSRVWGPLEERKIFGKAQWIIWPLDHFGPIKPGQIFTIEK